MIGRDLIVLSLVFHFGVMKSIARRHESSNQFTGVPNKFRYAKIVESASTNEQIINDHGAGLRFDQDPYKYQMRRRDLRDAETVSSELGVLDKEDRILLDKFYSNNKEDGDRFHYSALYDSANSNLQPGTEYHLSKMMLNSSRWHDSKPKSHTTLFAGLIGPMIQSNWTIDPHLLSLAQFGLPSSTLNYYRPPIATNSKGLANYSPVHRLLTSYDPIEKQLRAAMDTNQERGGRANRVSGVVLNGQTQPSEPMMSSKSAEKAVKLHDEMFENPPRDGVARVRMYFHRAIHDDVKLYGTGPWKYWGHGWGVEYGFDPKNLKNPNLYQKGYTIERAYGRDFCKDKKNCRPPDPNFFKEMPTGSR